MAERVICVAGLGYVGLPLALKFARKYKVIGFDIKKERVEELKRGYDRNLDIEKKEFEDVSGNIEFSSDEKVISGADIVVIAVPTPVLKGNRADLSYLESSSRTVGRNLKKGAIVVYESTTYPGCTEDFCLPILEKESGMKLGEFFLGYSPERVNPGDKEHTIDRIYKVVAGCNDSVADTLVEIYSVVTNVYKAPSIRIAEAAKVIENTQRDVNIALFNELAMLFDRMGLDSEEIFKAAATKWNFLRFYPGFVGGHCIPVDPYYLAEKAVEVGYYPNLILAGRGVSESVAPFVAKKIVKLLVETGKPLKTAKVLMLGATYKENVPDLRDSKVEILINELKDFGITGVTVHEPMLFCKDTVFSAPNTKALDKYDVIVYAVNHKKFKDLDVLSHLRDKGILIDIKRKFKREDVESRGFVYWGL
ncbi:MAG: nucleotide sugar dehydrogenase [Candidatus Aenigmarchaeota archaeon]|nr:nucleotide sugar dehydrogenase [Candidatus Aenigmarchaeota archaeon]